MAEEQNESLKSSSISSSENEDKDKSCSSSSSSIKSDKKPIRKRSVKVTREEKLRRLNVFFKK